jgi:hypothetical protein
MVRGEERRGERRGGERRGEERRGEERKKGREEEKILHKEKRFVAFRLKCNTSRKRHIIK